MAETICAVALDAATYAIDKLYSYRVPDELREQVQIGTRVLVPFGFGNKRAEGVVLAFREDTGEYRLKPIVEALEEAGIHHATLEFEDERATCSNECCED